MPLTAMHKIGPLLENVVRSLSPVRLITETAKVDRAAYFRNFKGYRVEKFTRAKILEISKKEIFERENDVWAQLLIVLWNTEHRGIYSGFRTRVQTINEDVEEVEAIPDDKAGEWLEEMLGEHVLEDLLICVHLNDVRFSDAFIREHMEKPLDIDRPAEENTDAEAEADASPEADAEVAPAS
jgi:hypothetical protein